MRSIKISVFLFALLVIGFFLGKVNTASAIVYLSPDPAGSVNNQNKINQALNNDGARENGILTVRLGKGTYVISDQIKIGSNTVLEGDPNSPGAIIKLKDHAGWVYHKPLIVNKGSSNSGITVQNFEINGNRQNNTDYDPNWQSDDNNDPNHNRYRGHYWYTLLLFTNVTNLTVDKMYLHDNLNDIMDTDDCNNVKFFNNRIRGQGHESYYIRGTDNVWAYNNDTIIECNSGFRPSDAKNVYIYNNTIGKAGGYAGVEMQMHSEVWICNNKISASPDIIDYDHTNTVHTTGCPTAGAPDFPPASDGGGDASGGDTTGGDTGGTGTGTGTSGGSTTTNYPYSSTSSLSSRTPVAVTPATIPSETQLNPLFPSPDKAPSSATTACRTDESAKNTAGLIPCGKSANDPATPWNECDPCDLCALVRMGQLNIEFLVKMAAVAATLAIILGGFLYIFAAGKEESVNKAKSMIKYTLIGFIVVFIAWAVVDSLLMTMGYIDPIDGQWYAMCGNSTAVIN